MLSRELTVPGAIVPVAGVTAVGVVPGHTRRGHLRALMRRQLDDVHARGEAVAALWASEGAIYGRFGYGPATRVAGYELHLAGVARRRDVALPARRPQVRPPPTRSSTCAPSTRRRDRRGRA